MVIRTPAPFKPGDSVAETVAGITRSGKIASVDFDTRWGWTYKLEGDTLPTLVDERIQKAPPERLKAPDKVGKQP
ncbi:MAG TPA: hypothetical protein VGK74_22305 [Symbiobacteriaceae bacterium]|jgi:hypothetical protein